MATVILTVHLILALALIIVVLLQRSEGGGLGIGGGGGGAMSGRSSATALSKVTWVLGIAFVITSLTLTIIAARDIASELVIDNVGTGGAVPDPDLPLPPGLSGDLLPPLPDDGPAAPPPVE